MSSNKRGSNGLTCNRTQKTRNKAVTGMIVDDKDSFVSDEEFKKDIVEQAGF
jgi:hypothetical protein